jgi:hypothetical protein
MMLDISSAKISLDLTSMLQPAFVCRRWIATGRPVNSDVGGTVDDAGRAEAGPAS